MDITLTDEPTRLVALHRETIRTEELPAFYDSAYTAVLAALTAAGAVPAGPALGWYAAMPSATVDVAAGFPVDGLPPGPLTQDVDVVELPGGRAVAAVHEGGYDGLPTAWEAVEQWRTGADLSPRGDFWEEYLTDPSPEGDPSLNRTRIVLPLR